MLNSLKSVLILLLVLFFYDYFYSQQRIETNKVDSLLHLSDRYINVDFEKSLIFAKKALEQSEKNDSEKRALSYYYIAKSLVFFRDFDESTIYIDKGLKETALKNNVQLKSQFLLLKSAYYGRMSLLEQSFQSIQEALSLLKNRNDTESKMLISTTYSYMSDYYTEIKDFHNAHLYSDKSIAEIEKIPLQKYLSSNRIFQNKSFIYFYKSWIYLQQEKPELAYPFIKKAYDQALLEKIDYLALFYEIYGDYYFQANQYKKAIDYYLLAEANKIKFKQNSAYVYSKIAKSYHKLGYSKKEVYYLEKSKTQFSIDQKEDQKNLQKELNRHLEKSEEEENAIKNTTMFIIILIIIVSIFSLIIVVIRYQKIRKSKRAIIAEQKIKLLEKESEITERESKIKILRHKVSNSSAELKDMVKENSPHFWSYFQEVHPDFCTKMLNISPTLKVSELTFCAYIYLGFANKEIAEYTFKSIRTIENNRYNLRKKLDLSSNVDLTVWIIQYLSPSE